MKYITLALLIVLVASSSLFADTTSARVLDTGYYILIDNTGIQTYMNGPTEVDEATYLAGVAAEEDARIDISNVDKLIKAAFLVVADELGMTAAEFRDAVKAKYNSL